MFKKCIPLVVLISIFTSVGAQAETSNKLLEKYGYKTGDTVEVEAGKLAAIEKVLSEKESKVLSKQVVSSLSEKAIERYIDLIAVEDLKSYQATQDMDAIVEEMETKKNDSVESLRALDLAYSKKAETVSKAIANKEAYTQQISYMKKVPKVTDEELKSLKSIKDNKDLQADVVSKAKNYKDIGIITGVKHPLDNDFLVTSPFGYRLHPVTLEAMSFHRGIDLSATTGTKILSEFNGVIELVAEDDITGKYVMINHGDGIKTLYGHMSEIDVKEGQEVKQYDPIGLSGATGRVTGPHLHFGLYINGDPVDPMKLY